ncbi:MAG: type II secretion system F family protein [Deltaproteobacteria bacterium]|nr:type II secretion system F family protein [Deltaproteobacteria bacterium]
MEALNSAVLKADLEKQGYFILGCRRRLFPFWHFSKYLGPRFSNRHFLSFNQEFLVLIRSGLPIVQALDVVIERVDLKNFHHALVEVKNAIRSGTTASEACSRFPEFFSPLYLASLQAGEKTGDLPMILARFISYQKKIEAVRQEVRKASFYPLLLLGAAVVTVTFLVLWVVPRLSQIFIGAQVSLPWATRFLIATANGLAASAVVLIPLTLAGIWGFKALAHTEKGQLILDAQKIRVPLVGALFLEYALSNFCRTLSVTLAGGIPVIQALQMATGTLNNRKLEKKFSAAINQVKGGDAVVNALERLGFFSTLALRLVAVGEKTGALPEMLNNVAEYYEMEINRRLDRLSSLIEPLLIVAAGFFIGGIIIAMYLPIFQLAGAVH